MCNVTLFILFYNQSKFVNDAIDGAFSQTYSPLEIIFSDDCSDDDTFLIISKRVSEYRGPHNVKINRNENNIGVVNHLNLIISKSQGSLLVASAGDDVSLPNRVSVIYEIWKNNNFCSCSIYSDAFVIDEKGKVIEKPFFDLPPEENDVLINRINNQARGVLGATHAWSKDIFERFGPLNSDVVCEDRTIAFRTYLIGKVIPVNVKLLKYRIHDRNTFQVNKKRFIYSHHLQRYNRINRMSLATFTQYRRDLEIASGFMEINDYTLAISMLDKIIKKMTYKIKYNEGSFGIKIKAIVDSVIVLGDFRSSFIMMLLLLFPPLMRIHMYRLWKKEGHFYT
jgi:glycosyltransferase involved in cell wall biosynthesis